MTHRCEPDHDGALPLMATSALPLDAWRKLGIAHFDAREFNDALIYFDQYLADNPADRTLINYKARALEALGRIEDSLHCIDRCLELDPQDVAELGNRAVLLSKLSRREEALASLERILLSQPNQVDALLKRAHLLYQMGRAQDALHSADRASLTAPQDAHALNMRGMILEDLGRHAEARADFESILAREPNFAEAITNIGIGYGRAGRYPEALASYDRSLSINPHQDNAIYNRAVIRLALGDWIQGFKDFESRWRLFPHEAARLTRLAPFWHGQCELKDKTILLHHEQGYGDSLQFARYVPLVAKFGARVIVASPAALKTLLHSLPGSPRIVSEGEPIPAHDFHCPLMSLPLAFATTPSNVPAQIPYLSADPVSIQKWGERLGPRRRLRIGLAWGGRQFPPINYARDMAFASIRPLLALQAEFYCLHTELSEEQRGSIAAHPNLTWVGKDLTDFADTAALMKNLDLIVTVDTAVVHLAGALGKPVWLMNRYATCWRWLQARSDSPWYPSLRVFRQPAMGDWDAVVREVLREGKKLLGAFDDLQLRKGSSRSPDDEWFVKEFQQALDAHNRGRYQEAIEAYRRILCERPDQPDLLHYLGVALAQSGGDLEALACLSSALKFQPNNAVLHNHRGNVLAALSRLDEALSSYDRAIACDASLADAHFNKGVALVAQGASSEALRCYERAVAIDPDNAKAHNNLGNLQAGLNKEAEALESYERAIEANPRFVDPWINKSNLLRRLHRYYDAIDSSLGALTCASDHAEAHNSLGAALAGLGRFADAKTSYRRALELQPDLPEAQWNMGLVELAQGDFANGWPHYESRWAVKSLKLPRRYSAALQWRGSESLSAKRVLLHAEQGYGDTIQFARYCAAVTVRGAHVILSAPSSLHGLFRTLPGVQELVDSSATAPFDFHCPLMSLPGAFGTEATTIPNPARYLSAPDEAKLRWGAIIADRQGRLRVGFCWSGRVSHSNDANRSMALERLAPLYERDIQAISLQKEIRASDRKILETRGGIARSGEELVDFADTAGLIENLDLVVTVDTAVAHLAGALGVPVWVLLPYVADWRWLQDREDSPWYASARLFRQKTLGDWGEVLVRVSSAIEKLAKSTVPLAPGRRKNTRRSRPQARQQ